MITFILCVLSFIAGALVFRRHRAAADSIEAKGRQALDALKGK